MNDSKVYFPGLNGLRFFAALAVIITHIELMKKYLGFHHLWMDSGQHIRQNAFTHIMNGEIHWASPIVAEAGPLGVVFFFVLSGFLITFLLLAEKEKHGTISVRKFYLRRILRIWPLYFLIFVLGFFVLPHLEWFQVPDQSAAFEKNFWGNFWCYLLFVPNLAASLFMAVPNIGQSWSIGVEEQFYIIWPVIMKFFKKSLRAILVVTAVLLLVKAGVVIYSKYAHNDWIEPLKKFLAMLKIECMTLGGLGAYALFNKKEMWLRIVYSKATQVAAFVMIPVLLYFTPAFIQDGVHLAFGVCFLVIILNVSTNEKSFVKLNRKWLDELGKISYGIYMYHLLCVVLVLHAMKATGVFAKQMSMAQNILVYATCILLTIVVSYFSYHFFETRFIRMKKKVTRIVSGDEAR